LAKGLANLIWKCSEKTNQAIVAMLEFYFKSKFFFILFIILCLHKIRPTQQAHFAPVNKYKTDGLTETVIKHYINIY